VKAVYEIHSHRKTSAFLSDEFYITTDKQVYYALVAICPIDEKHEDGAELVRV